MAKYKYFWEYPISGDTAAHRLRGGKPATDFTTPMNTPIHAPIFGVVTRKWFSDAGNTVDITNSKWVIRIAHNNSFAGKSGLRAWRSLIAYSGNTGMTTGPHVHAFVINRKTGERMSFAEWLIRYPYKNKKNKLPYNVRKFFGI